MSGVDIIFENGFELQSCNQAELLNEDFNKSDQIGWNGMWQESGSSIDVAEIINNQGKLTPLASNSPYSLARIYHPLNNAIDAEVNFSFEFEDAASQGLGMYLRGNGGYLENTIPPGQGYAVFIERFTGQSRLGLWYEHNGIETAFVREPLMPTGIAYDFINNIIYHVRFQVFQEDTNNTRLRAKIWQDGNTEPTQWGVNVSDDYAPLQNTPGAVVVDSFNSQSSGQILQAIIVDNIVVKKLCNPF